ncbi:sugar ABC transporter permease [Kineococcus sp. NPDC059986]|uniref:carbohydrate ABC transporter permease n=1 Tax=Kineococcus sp. NPDC059986 TaxID=3155538 RepID=UPI00344BC5C5
MSAVSATTGRRTGRRPQWLTPLLLGLPALAVVLLSQGYPLVRQLVMSFQEFGLRQQFGQPPEFVGLKNYAAVFSDSVFWVVLARSIVFCAVCAALTMLLGVAFAVLMTRLVTAVRVVLQSAMLLAWAIPVLSSLTVWQWLFNTRNGLVNWVLVHAGLDQFDRYAWLLQGTTLLVIAGVIVVWMSVPLVVFMVYASLTQLDPEVLEAAELDGASGIQRFRYVTVPGVAPVLMLVGLLQIIWDIRVFTQISVLQDAGGVAEDSNLLGTYVYQIGLGQGNYGMGSAVAMVMLVITLALTAGYVRSLVRQGATA